jgi:hypothetical protein
LHWNFGFVRTAIKDDPLWIWRFLLNVSTIFSVHAEDVLLDNVTTVLVLAEKTNLAHVIQIVDHFLSGGLDARGGDVFTGLCVHVTDYGCEGWFAVGIWGWMDDIGA